MESSKAAGTVLVVDDDHDIRELLSAWLEGMGHDVKVAEDAAAALRLMETHPIDLAVCDIAMPERNGIWLLQQVRTHYPAVAAVVATGLDEMDPAVTLGPGVVGYIVKPFSRRQLAAVVQRGLDERTRLAARSMEDPFGDEDELDELMLRLDAE